MESPDSPPILPSAEVDSPVFQPCISRRCKTCNKEFIPRNRFQEYCKPSHRPAQPSNKVKKRCTICGREFLGRATKVTCSYKCRKQAIQEKYVKQYTPVPLIDRVCATCGATFKGKRNQHYCPDKKECAEAGYKASKHRKRTSQTDTHKDEEE